MLPCYVFLSLRMLRIFIWEYINKYSKETLFACYLFWLIAVAFVRNVLKCVKSFELLNLFLYEHKAFLPIIKKNIYFTAVELLTQEQFSSRLGGASIYLI